ncbi:hypothetical protein ACLK1S_25680 [Escherichia coli]
MIANIIDTTPAESLCADDTANVINAGIQRRACSTLICLLDKNQTCHLASAQCSFPWSQYYSSVLLILWSPHCFIKTTPRLRNNKELVKWPSPLTALLPAGHGTPSRNLANLPLVENW